jgi:hypothetical protein
VTYSQNNTNLNDTLKPDLKGFREQRLREVFSIYNLLASTFNDLSADSRRYLNAHDLQLAAKARTTIRIKISDADLFLDLHYGKKGQSAQNFFAAQGLQWPLFLSYETAAEPTGVPYVRQHLGSAPYLVEEVSAVDNVIDQVGTSDGVEGEREHEITQVPRCPMYEGAPPTRNQTLRVQSESRIISELDAYFAVTSKIMGQNELHRLTGIHKSVIRPIWRAYAAKQPETAYISSRPCEKPLVEIEPLVELEPLVANETQSDLLIGAEYTRGVREDIDNAVTVFMQLRHNHRIVFVTCNVLSDSEESDLIIAQSSDGIISSFAQTVVSRLSAHEHNIAIWERQPGQDNNGRLHIHCLFALPLTERYPTQKLIEEIWLSHLPQQTLLAPNGAPLPLRGNEVKIEPYDDFSNLDNTKYYFSKISKKYHGKTKFLRHHSDGKKVAPQHWEYISPTLKTCAGSALIQYRLPLRGRDAAFNLIDEIAENVCPGSWRATVNRYKNQNAITGYESKFLSEHIPAIANEINIMVQAALDGPDSLPEAEALHFALIKIHPSGLITMGTSKLPVRRRAPKARTTATKASKRPLVMQPP